MSNKTTQTIQFTSKKLKKQLIIMVLVVIIGIIFLLATTGANGNSGRIIGVLLTIGGLIGMGFVKTKIWWYHK